MAFFLRGLRATASLVPFEPCLPPDIPCTTGALIAVGGSIVLSLSVLVGAETGVVAGAGLQEVVRDAGISALTAGNGCVVLPSSLLVGTETGSGIMAGVGFWVVGGGAGVAVSGSMFL
jgi:hypothetical protein